ncbi:hypothetical protein I6A60_37920 [Frankia sp. AgB1.9]|uniref:hypothetical protein n=1 Tax=unclassified Frankia TaxID=2632575 RepID=UPI001931D7F7|nr:MULTISPECIES: hypothetical protein [unclassified Frankia]MBL7494334.1 hypothetical protein [Frankia sp. AgW1.1]MBL7553573.1 hypothetical protein [Frankia sp. AgB1.9]MBL7622235.1 hypothetical protein [Frankia sp. AgB1.8]
MSEEARQDVFDQLCRVVAGEIEAQVAVRRPVEAMAPLIADALLDVFDIMLRPPEPPGLSQREATNENTPA